MSARNLQYEHRASGIINGLPPANDYDMRVHLDDIDYRVRHREEFKQLPRLAGGTILYNLNGTYADAEVEKALLANREWELQGVNMTDALVTRATDGGLTLTTAGADADSAILAALQEATVKADGGAGATYDSFLSSVLWASAKKPIFRARFKANTSAQGEGGTAIYWLGLKLTSTDVIVTDNDQFFFRGVTGATSANWHVVSSNNNTDEDTTTGVAIAEAATYTLEVKVDGNMVPYFYINGLFVKKAAALRSLTTFRPFFGVKQSGAAAACSAIVRYIDIHQDRA